MSRSSTTPKHKVSWVDAYKGRHVLYLRTMKDAQWLIGVLEADNISPAYEEVK